MSWESAIAEAVATLDVAALRAQYQAQGSLLDFPPFLPRPLVDAMVGEARRMLPAAHRTRVPFVRTAGAVPHATLVERAPALTAFQRSQSLHALFQTIVGVDIEPRREDDPQSSALYVYDRAGDGIGWHRDQCGCEPDAAFTVLLGLVNESRARLQFLVQEDELVSFSTPPGAVYLFCGSKGHHRVTPLEKGGLRVVYSSVYSRKGLHPKGFGKLVQGAIDSFLYFGLWR